LIWRESKNLEVSAGIPIYYVLVKYFFEDGFNFVLHKIGIIIEI